MTLWVTKHRQKSVIFKMKKLSTDFFHFKTLSVTVSVASEFVLWPLSLFVLLCLYFLFIPLIGFVLLWFCFTLVFVLFCFALFCFVLFCFGFVLFCFFVLFVWFVHTV